MFSKIPGPSLMKSSKRKKYDHVSYICEDISSSEEDSSNKDNISKEGNTCNKNFGILLDINRSPFREKVRKKHEMNFICFNRRQEFSSQGPETYLVSRGDCCD